MRYTHAGRLELDLALQRLIERARAVGAGDERIRALLRANLEMARGVDLTQVLHRLVVTARQLVRARYAALGVVEDGHITEFVYDGMDAATADRMAHEPEGRGLLGLLLAEPLPVRVADISRHPGSVGFPEHHPPMTSFLGVPIVSGGRLLGNFYLTEKQGEAEFSALDEELIIDFAEVAAAAIANASIFTEACRRHAWQEAMVMITERVLGGVEPDTLMAELISQAERADRADGACVVLLSPDGLTVTAVQAMGTLKLLVDAPDALLSVCALVMAERRVLVVEPGADPRLRDLLGTAHPWHILIAPLTGQETMLGAMLLSKKPAEGPFDAVDVEMASVFAGQASLALELAGAADLDDGELTDQHLAFAEGLRERFLHRLTRISFSLRSLVDHCMDIELREQAGYKLAEMDALIDHLKSLTFQRTDR
ncbi:GAF domain-containing protein [Catellatospora vulcania]|uniref:GAF domain-containing protein n=1 Tax=Catellatospora vulcania TaxID=1460450 RepID=UPI0018AF7447|nr:GAF domain-containing protein [Catellatospora vulcania]